MGLFRNAKIKSGRAGLVWAVWDLREGLLCLARRDVIRLFGRMGLGFGSGGLKRLIRGKSFGPCA